MMLFAKRLGAFFVIILNLLSCPGCTENIYVEEQIPYTTTYQSNPSLYYFEENTIEEGEDGIDKVAYAPNEDGGPDYTKEKGRKHIKLPVSAVTETGTKKPSGKLFVFFNMYRKKSKLRNAESEMVGWSGFWDDNDFNYNKTAKGCVIYDFATSSLRESTAEDVKYLFSQLSSYLTEPSNQDDEEKKLCAAVVRNYFPTVDKSFNLASPSNKYIMKCFSESNGGFRRGSLCGYIDIHVVPEIKDPTDASGIVRGEVCWLTDDEKNDYIVYTPPTNGVSTNNVICIAKVEDGIAQLISERDDLLADYGFYFSRDHKKFAAEFFQGSRYDVFDIEKKEWQPIWNFKTFGFSPTSDLLLTMKKVSMSYDDSYYLFSLGSNQYTQIIGKKEMQNFLEEMGADEQTVYDPYPKCVFWTD